MGVIFCKDSTSSITCDSPRICAMTLVISRAISQYQANARIGLIKFRSRYDVWTTIVHGFASNIGELEQWLRTDEPSGVCPDGYEAVGDALNEALKVKWHKNNDDQKFNKKFVILITDGAPNGLFTPLFGADPWVISNKFLEKGITLIVVGVGESILACDDFYCALAKNTGGLYIPMINFERIFLSIIESVFREENTCNQAFRHLNIEEIEENSSFKYSAMKDRVDGMIKECQTMNDIRELFFNHRSSDN